MSKYVSISKKEGDVFQIDYPDNEEGELTGRLFPSVWQGSEFNNETGRDQIKDLFGKAIFDYPKPVDLIKHCILLAGEKDGIVLDSFSGSGTTAQATVELNLADGGERKFILAECEEYADKITAERVRKVIKECKQGAPKGTNPSFSYFELGDPIEMKSILEGKKLPSYMELARYIFYTATGEQFNPKNVDEKKYFIGESAGYEVYLFYKPNMEYLKSTALTLELAKSLGPYHKKKRIVFAPSKYLDTDYLLEYRIVYCQLPFEIYKLKE